MKIIIWDNDGTIMGSKDPNDITGSKVIMPNIENVMHKADVNVICSGCKTEESERHNFDPITVTKRFRELMKKLPINFAVFSPKIGGVECYIAMPLELILAHENPKFKEFVGEFKKPGIGMLVIIKDMLEKQYKNMNLIMIGDTWHDKEAAQNSGIKFVEAQKIHQGYTHIW